MFTGLVEETGQILEIVPGNGGIRFSLQASDVSRGMRIGDSLAVNGCCLTVVDLKRTGKKSRLEFDLLQETWERTNFSEASVGDCVNLERALALGDRLGGHFVTGHIDVTGRIARWERSGVDHVLEIACSKRWHRLLVEKGSIAVDGISLTVAAVTRAGFRLWIIPHTYAVTALAGRKVGDKVNLEFDLLAKHVERLIRH